MNEEMRIRLARELVSVSRELVADMDAAAQRYFDFVVSEMRRISPKLIVTLNKKRGFLIKLRGKKPMGEELADKLTLFFRKYPVDLYGDWYTHKEPIQAKETELQIVPRTGDSISRHINLESRS